MCVKDNRLLTSGADGRIRIRQLETGVLLREIEETYDAVYDTAFGDVAGKDIIAIGSRNGRAILDVSQIRKCYIPKLMIRSSIKHRSTYASNFPYENQRNSRASTGTSPWAMASKKDTGNLGGVSY